MFFDIVAWYNAIYVLQIVGICGVTGRINDYSNFNVCQGQKHVLMFFKKTCCRGQKNALMFFDIVAWYNAIYVL
jgi:hypothetical protein